LQEKVEPDYLGRVFGVLGMISSALMPLGMLVFGPISDFVKIEWLLMGTGVLLIIQGLVLIGDRVLIEAGQPTENSKSKDEPEPEPQSEP
jgi:DHA3 family macrolide efflux protein-like MFS transporter